MTQATALENFPETRKTAPILNNHPLKRVGSNNGLKVRIRVD
ncbi:hypothetical protein [Methylomarinum vadi]|nr:hypothetical protein [Methylomarinum vadi]